MIISRAPVRISFFGGGTDYPEHFCEHGGAVLATTIDKFSYVTISPFLSHLFDYSIRISYRETELVKSVDDIRHNVYRECLKLCGLKKDLELHNLADLPAFTGLGSSSAFTVSLLQALHSFKGEFLRPMELAYEAIHVERNVLKDKVGCQDQVLAAMGGFNLIQFRTESDISVQRMALPPARLGELEQHLLLVFTDIRRKACEVVDKQLKRISQNTPTLREMCKMAYEGHDILTQPGRSLHEFGELLHHAWTAKCKLDGGVSSPEIDAMYEGGRKAGAIGGKLLGAGGGGFMLFFAPPDTHENLKRVFKGKQLLSVKMAVPGSQIIFSA
jgi:D-glycero-alpha-D-manno-heptose-7-phosphate kinase